MSGAKTPRIRSASIHAARTSSPLPFDIDTVDEQEDSPPETERPPMLEFTDNPNAIETRVSAKQDLPPPRRGKALRSVSPPLSSTRLSRLVYLLVALSALLSAYYAYRLARWEADMIVGWRWARGSAGSSIDQGTGILRKFRIGRAGAGLRRGEKLKNAGSGSGNGNDNKDEGSDGGGSSGSVEDKINGLARALGIPPRELASAIAVVVRERVPDARASLSSVAARETGPAVRALVQGVEAGGRGKV